MRQTLSGPGLWGPGRMTALMHPLLVATPRLTLSAECQGFHESACGLLLSLPSPCSVLVWAHQLCLPELRH